MKQTVWFLRATVRELDIVWRRDKILHAILTTAVIVGGVLTIGGIKIGMTSAAATPLLIAGMIIGGLGVGLKLKKSSVVF